MASLQHWQKMAIFLVLDVLPEHIQQTFGLTSGGLVKLGQPNVQVVQMGGTIPDKLDFALIIHHTSQHHIDKAYELQKQIESLDSRTFVYSIAVQQGEAGGQAGTTAPKVGINWPMWGGGSLVP